MKRICAWCNREMGIVESDNGSQYSITHGICEACARKITLPLNQAFRDFLDRLEVPVILVESGVGVYTSKKIPPGSAQQRPPGNRRASKR